MIFEQRSVPVWEDPEEHQPSAGPDITPEMVQRANGEAVDSGLSEKQGVIRATTSDPEHLAMEGNVPEADWSHPVPEQMAFEVVKLHIPPVPEKEEMPELPLYEMSDAEKKTLEELSGMMKERIGNALEAGDFDGYLNAMKGFNERLQAEYEASHPAPAGMSEEDRKAEAAQAVKESLMPYRLYHALIGSTEMGGTVVHFDFPDKAIEKYIRNEFLVKGDAENAA